MSLAAVPAVLMALALPASPHHTATTAQAPACAGDDVTTVLCLINAQRAANGVRPVRLDKRLAAVARAHSADMVAHTYFGHSSRSGASFVSRIAGSGWMRRRRGWAVGEDLAWGTGDRGTPAGLVAAWMASPPHRTVLLDPAYRVTGVGIASGVPVAGGAGGGAGVTCTADFGS
jgi:uncharacterized protein YkwD